MMLTHTFTVKGYLVFTVLSLTKSRAPKPSLTPLFFNSPFIGSPHPGLCKLERLRAAPEALQSRTSPAQPSQP